MNEKKLSYYNSMFMGATLFLTLFLIYKFPGITVFYFAELYIIVNIVKNIIMHKLGFDFRGFGIKKMIALDLSILVLFVVWHISAIND